MKKKILEWPGHVWRRSDGINNLTGIGDRNEKQKTLG